MSIVAGLFERRAARFLLVGGSAAGAFFVLSYVLVAWLAVPAFLAAAIAYAVAFVGAYLAQRAWTFGGSRSHSHALPRYLATQIFCAFLTACIAHVSTWIFGASPSLMAATSALVASGVSYVLSSRWAFR